MMTTQLAWLLLLVAGALEIVWVVGLKFTEGFTRLWPSTVTIAAMVVSLVLLAHIVRVLPVGTAYAVWTGIGAAGAALVGMAIFGEARDLLRLMWVAMIVAGTLGLKFSA